MQTTNAVDLTIDGRHVDELAAPVAVAVVLVAITPYVPDRWSLVDELRPRYGNEAPRTTTTDAGVSHDLTSSPFS